LSLGTKPSGRRGGREIAHDIITAADAGARKTAIMYGSRLNPRQLSKHLGRLIRDGFIEHDSEKAQYCATHKGKRYVKAFEKYLATRDLLAEQELVLEAFWRDGIEPRLKGVAGDGYAVGREQER
jgi:predicted transcriptional regulator